MKIYKRSIDLLVLLLLVFPEKAVEKVTNEEETATKNGTNCEESDSLLKSQNFEDWIDPETSNIIDVVDPDQIAKK